MGTNTTSISYHYLLVTNIRATVYEGHKKEHNHDGGGKEERGRDAWTTIFSCFIWFHFLMEGRQISVLRMERSCASDCFFLCVCDLVAGKLRVL
jgi:hypothetical protein